MAINEPPVDDPTPPVDDPKPPVDDPAPEPLDFGSEDVYNQFRESLSDEQKELPIFKETKSLKALADQTVNAQKMLGKQRLPVPSDDWGDNEWDDFYSKLRPETSSDYELPESLELKLSEDGETKEYKFDEETTGQLKEVAHNLGLTKRQANQLAQVWAERTVGAEGSLNEQIASDVKEKVSSLQKEWGDQYEVNHRAANEAYEALVQEIPELAELMEWSPQVANHPAVMKLFNRLSPLVSDLGLQGGGGDPAGFGDQTVAGLKAQIEEIDTQHQQLIMSDPSEMSMADRQKRERILAQRTALYKKLYPPE
jgi:hypothetical protein